jgi:hypothetical protein
MLYGTLLRGCNLSYRITGAQKTPTHAPTSHRPCTPRRSSTPDRMTRLRKVDSYTTQHAVTRARHDSAPR